MRNLLVNFVIIMVLGWFVGLFLFSEKQITPHQECVNTTHEMDFNLHGLPSSAKGIWKWCMEEENRRWVKQLSKQ